MRKLLIFMLVLGIASIANATYVLSYDGSIDVSTDSSGGPWEDYWILVCPTVDAVISGGTNTTALDLSQVWTAEVASDYTVPAGQDGTVGVIASSTLTATFTGVTDTLILENFTVTWQSGKTETTATLYRTDGSTNTYESSLLIPEPMTIMLLGLGGLFLRRRR